MQPEATSPSYWMFKFTLLDSRGTIHTYQNMIAPRERDNGVVPGGSGQGPVGGRLMLMMEQQEPELICATECAHRVCKVIKRCELLTEHVLTAVSFFSDTLYLGKKLILDV